MKSKIKPGFNKIALELQNNEEKTSTGLIIPDAFERPTQKTTIVAVGKTKSKWSVGDIAYIRKAHAGWDIGEGLLVVQEEEILYTISD
jgi:co-chaperonin GroES (HSP10)